MHWIDIVWPTLGALNLALGLIHFLIWFRRRSEPANLAFLSATLAVAALAVIELGLMRAQSAAQYASLFRWAMVSMVVLLCSLTAFVWLYFRAGSLRAAVASCVLHVATLLPNFAAGDNLMFTHVSGLEYYLGWDGSRIAVPIATPSPWMLLWYLSDAVMVGYFASVIRDLRRRGDAEERQRATLLCGAMIVFVVSGVSWAVLVSHGWLAAPFLVNVPFVGVMLIMSFLLGEDVIRAAQLNQALARSRAELDVIERRLGEAAADRERFAAELAARHEELAHLSRVWLVAELSGSIAHELNQPLTAVLSNAQASLRFLDRDPPDVAEAREGLVEVIASDKRAGDVIRRLRAMLRKEPIDFQRLDLHEVVDEVARMLRGDLVSRGMELALEVAPGQAWVMGDRVQLQQVLLNLLVNACDAMEAGGAGKCVTLRSRALPAGGIELAVHDQGIGIRAEDAEAIFRPFYTTKPQGMGIGLAVCRSIAQAHGGRLAARPDTPRGTVLTLQLPAA